MPGVKIDILERLPVPYGLVRFGVAPDHPEVKVCALNVRLHFFDCGCFIIGLVVQNVISTFEKVAESPKVRFMGNVEVGKDISMAELQERYAGIVLAYGADQDKTFGLPGTSTEGLSLYNMAQLSNPSGR